MLKTPIALTLLLATHAQASEYLEAQVDAEIVPGPVEYAVLAPAGYRQMSNLPLVLSLHGGGGSRDHLKRMVPIVQNLWATDAIPPAIFVTPSVGKRSFYMNYADGSARWEDFIMGPLLAHLRASYPLSGKAEATYITGISMGGMGSLRMAFKYPDRFAAVAALEPGIEPILTYDRMLPKHRFFRSNRLMKTIYGNPIEPEFWNANNPAKIVHDNADAVKGSGLQIYIEAGDLDQLWLYEGAEFLHRQLWDLRIMHEYHLVRGADHIGGSLPERFDEATRFLFRTARPWPAAAQRNMRRLLRMRNRLDATDHYNETD